MQGNDVALLSLTPGMHLNQGRQKDESSPVQRALGRSENIPFSFINEGIMRTVTKINGLYRIHLHSCPASFVPLTFGIFLQLHIEHEPSYGTS